MTAQAPALGVAQQELSAREVMECAEAFIGVMFNGRVPETVDTPLGIPVKVGKIYADLQRAIAQHPDPLAQPGAAQGTDGASLIVAERQRQIDAEGWMPEHDDEHDGGEMVKAAVCYAEHAVGRAWIIDANADGAEKYRNEGVDRFSDWLWDEQWWKPRDPIRDLVRAGALIAAEIDRLQRTKEPK